MTEPALLLADEPTGNLDTSSTAEIMRLFSVLNHEGRTIILITHEEDVAACANRVIHLRDGIVLSDERSVPASSAGTSEARDRLTGVR